MANLFSKSQISQIQQVADKSRELIDPKPKQVNVASISNDIDVMSADVIAYFKDSPAILITSVEQLHDYIDKIIQFGCAGIDTETTGLDRIRDTIVGASLYVPGMPECYIPCNHIIPIFDTPYKNQLSYDDVHYEFQRLVDNNVKLAFANADFDLSMIYKDFKVDLCPSFYYDVILAWRCLKEDEKDNSLKGLYNKYVLKNQGDPKKFSDFFTPALFPYCKPEVAKLYAGNDARITYELMEWQLPFILKDNAYCKKHHLESISDLIWHVEFPLVSVCQKMHRTGMYLDKTIANVLVDRYRLRRNHLAEELVQIVDTILQTTPPVTGSIAPPFTSGSNFNPKSTLHVQYLLYDLLRIPPKAKRGNKSGRSTDKEILQELNLDVTNQILKIRSLDTLIDTFVTKLPKSRSPKDGRIHASFKQIGASTGRFSSESPNLQNIPSHAEDIRHMFRATSGYVMLSSDYSAQEPRIVAFVSQDKKLIESFQQGRDVYASVASFSFGVPYEECLEFHPETGEYQPEGKHRRGEAKFIVLGICYGRSVPSIAEQLYGKDTSLLEDDKIAKAQKVYDSVLAAFPGLRAAMLGAQKQARDHGYVETILGRRRHLPDMQLPEFEFRAASGYVNPDIDPLDISTLQSKNDIPDRIVQQLDKELKSYRYAGQVYKRIRELKEEGIIVINNRQKIADASRQTLNSIIQGSAADQTKMALLELENNEEWSRIGGRLLVPVHDEIIAEVPIEHYQRGGEILQECMLSAAKFLPFDSKCDVTSTLRWYGLEYPCPHIRPTNIDTDIADEVSWIQWHLVEMEYSLPTIPNPDGSSPRGNAARGVNGIITEEYKQAIQDYIHTRNITAEDFISTLEREVLYGVQDR